MKFIKKSVIIGLMSFCLFSGCTVSKEDAFVILTKQDIEFSVSKLKKIGSVHKTFCSHLAFGIIPVSKIYPYKITKLSDMTLEHAKSINKDVKYITNIHFENKIFIMPFIWTASCVVVDAEMNMI